MKKNYLCIALFIFIAQFNYSQNTYKRVSIPNTSESVILELQDLGIDLTCGVIINDSKITLELFDYELDLLSDQGINYSILIDDLTKFYSQRAVEDLPKAKAQLAAEKALSATRSYSVNEVINNVGQYNECDEIDWAVPVNWNLNPTASPNSFGGCLTLTQVLQELDDMRTLYPNLISVKTDVSPSSQTTVEGRTVYYVRISDNPDVDEATEPETLYQSLIHSREAATVMNQLFFMWYLLENYATDDAIKNLVNNQALYFIPVYNPDGFVYNQTVAPDGGGGQRKNRNVSAGSCSTYLYGIDLNRNSAYYWGNGGSSTDPCSSTYMGTAQFSEPETQIMRDFFLLHDFGLALNHHSYKNAMLHAYAGTTITNPRPDEYSKYNHDMTYYNRYAHGPSTSISALNSGNMNDWMLGGPAGVSANGTPTGTGSGKNTLSWTPENGLSSEGTGGTYGGFWPAPSNYLPIAKRAMRMNFLAAYFSGKYAKLHDLNQSDITALSGNLNFAIENLGQTASDFTLTVTPVSSNLLTVGGASTQTGMTVLQQNNVNISYTLDPSIQANDEIEFKVVLTNDYALDNVLYEANIVKTYNPSNIIIVSTDNLTNWTPSGGTWSTTSDAYSASTAITSTSGASYANNEAKQLQMNGSVDLSGNSTFLIQYYAKWDLERSFDYVQIEGSTNGSTWTPLCGKLTKPGAPNANNTYSGKGGVGSADNNFQPDDEPLYDGDTQDKWNMEEILIDGTTNTFLFNESTVYLRFDFKTDSSNREDSYYNVDFEGFTFDDFKIIEIQVPCVTSVPTGLAISTVTITTATADWDFIPSATYDLRYRIVGSPSWINVNDLATNNYMITGLTDASDYEVQVRTRCISSTSVYSTSANFTTASVIPCSGPSISSYPYTENWDTNIGDWSQGAGDSGNWTYDLGGTPSNNTGPSDDFTGGQDYFFTEASNSSDPGPNATVYLISPCFDLTGYINPNFSYYYHMYGVDMGSLDLDVSIDNGANWINLITITGQQQTDELDPWLQQNINLNSYQGQTIKLRFAGNTGNGSGSDMAIDQINLTAAVGSITWYADSDSDTFGDPNVSQVSASQLAGYVADNTDCDDSNNTVYPGAPELCDGLDNDCNTLIDDGFGPEPPAVNCWDNFVFNTTTCVWENQGSQDPEPPAVNCWDNYQFNTTTCVWENQGSQDPEPPAVNCWDNYQFNTTSCLWENLGDGSNFDIDGDGHYALGACLTPADDCDDNDATVYPGAPEIQCNGIDENCNGMVDDTDSIDPVCAAQDITVTLDGLGNATISALDIDNGSIDNCGIDTMSISQSLFNTSNIGLNTVTFTVMDYEGNDSSCDVTVTIEEDTLTMTEFNENTVEISPNPFGSFIHIHLPLSFNNSDFDITIFDLNGRIVLKRIMTSSNRKIEVDGLEQLEEATYFMKITSKLDGSSVYKKLIKHE